MAGIKCALIILAFYILASSIHPFLIVTDSGNWPEHWPKELEPLRDQTISVDGPMNYIGVQNQIFFDSREQFERLWPHFFKVLSKGGNLTLCKKEDVKFFEPPARAANVKSLVPILIIDSPAENFWSEALGIPYDGKKEIQWPDHFRGPDGSLYGTMQKVEATSGTVEWKPIGANADGKKNFHKVRTDIALVVDGTIVDLNRIPFPPNAKIIDRRWDAETGN